MFKERENASKEIYCTTVSVLLLWLFTLKAAFNPFTNFFIQMGEYPCLCSLQTGDMGYSVCMSVCVCVLGLYYKLVFHTLENGS